MWAVYWTQYYWISHWNTSNNSTLVKFDCLMFSHWLETTVWLKNGYELRLTAAHSAHSADHPHFETWQLSNNNSQPIDFQSHIPNIRLKIHISTCFIIIPRVSYLSHVYHTDFSLNLPTYTLPSVSRTPIWHKFQEGAWKGVTYARAIPIPSFSLTPIWHELYRRAWKVMKYARAARFLKLSRSHELSPCQINYD